MKKIFVLLAAVVMTAGVVSAQDINQATEAYNNGAMELQMGNGAAALTNFQNALTMAEGLGEDAAELVENCKTGVIAANMAIARALYNSKDFTGAIEAFNQTKAVAESYGNTEMAEEAAELAKNSQMNIYNTAGAAAKRSKDYPTAIENYSKVIEMDPANGAAAFQLGDCYYRSKNFAEAEKYFLVAKENGQEKNAVPRLANIALNQAKAAIKGKKYQEAYDFANASLGYDASSNAYETAGDAAKGLNKTAEAISLYEKALEGAKPKAANQIKYKIATTAQETGDKAKAIEYYTAIAGDPNFAEFANYQIKELSK